LLTDEPGIAPIHKLSKQTHIHSLSMWREFMAMRILTVSLAIFMLVEGPVHAASVGTSLAALSPKAASADDTVPVAFRRGGVAFRGGRAFVGPRGGFAVRRGGAVVRPGWHGGGVQRAGIVRPGWNGGGVRRPLPPPRPPRPGPRPGWVGPWARPAGYWWGPGAAVAAGAAIGFVGAASAVAWAGAPPAPNMCWYYTDPSKRQGFWDACP
jgi:hypothetical protein